VQVNAPRYLFIQCIWVYPKKNRQKGLGSVLLEECLKDAKALGKVGVASITGDGPFIARRSFCEERVFGYRIFRGGYELVSKRLKDGPLPEFLDWKSQLIQYKGLHLIYSDQCQWVARSVPELRDIAKLHGIEMMVTELKTPEEARDAPSVYATLTIVYDGVLFADHFLPGPRFFSILKKFIKLDLRKHPNHPFDEAKV
jgi:hypothetical protein